MIKAYLPTLDVMPQRTAVCLYTLLPDRHFIIGPAPQCPDITLLAGFSGHGFNFAPIIEEAAGHFATDGGTVLPVEVFAPTRFRSAA